MKKSLFFVAAASALMLTACSSEDDILQTGQTKKVAPQEVGFDVYTPAATDVTRAGQAGTMTTGRLQRLPANGGGFGVYAYLIEDVNTASGNANASSYLKYGDGGKSARSNPIAPNYMVNQLVEWNKTNQGWTYDPLKYWPNETDNDSQNTNAQMEGISGSKHLDRLTFFAYAPYVATGVNEIGITKLTNKKGDLVENPTTTTTGTLVEASVGYKAALSDPSSSVDLLWGVAPAGGLGYTAVNGRSVYVPEGEPLMDMTKPDVNTSMKFLFNHALARIGVNVVAAVDQVGAGGTLDPKTRITINEVKLTGKFGETGVLNLDNPKAKIAHWVDINGTPINSETTSLPTSKILTISGDNIAPDLRYAGEHTFGEYSAQPTGVTTSKKDLINGRYYSLDETPAYSPARMYYNSDGTEKHATYAATAANKYYEKDGNDYKVKTGTISSPDYPEPLSGYYSIVQGEITYTGSHIKVEHKYTAEEVAAYNASLGDAVSAGDVQTPAVLYTAETAAAYNATKGAISTTTVLTAAQATTLNGLSGVDKNDYAEGDNPSDGDATIYNAQLSGLVAVGDEQTPAVLYTAETAATHNAGLTGAVTTDDVNPATSEYGYSTLDAYTALYTKSGDNYTYVGLAGTTTLWGAAIDATYYTIATSAIPATSIAYAYEAPVYDVERNYFMVVPTNNVKEVVGELDSDVEKDLRTIRVKIEYYVTTEDSKVLGGYTQTKNIIEKDVVFPSLANGKSYMLNLVLGLTSVKMDAEVDEWKVVNVQADLPQNTAD